MGLPGKRLPPGEPVLGHVPPCDLVLVPQPAEVIDDVVLAQGVEVDQAPFGVTEDDVPGEYLDKD